jgi:serine/threonine protein kinase
MYRESKYIQGVKVGDCATSAVMWQSHSIVLLCLSSWLGWLKGVSHICRAMEKSTNRICALKMVKMNQEKEGFPLTSIREINILLSFHHPNIVNVSEVVVGAGSNNVYMVMDYAEHDLRALQQKQKVPFSVPQVQATLTHLTKISCVISPAGRISYCIDWGPFCLSR